ncbi:amidase [Thelonectria olida]|uniref:Amidase n=1 Tax=Thelonectria olida TaxID=1576542 RepID=A0A9P8VZU4_9HYPO|nr:amidase [Thelonectria olida]
MPLLTDEAPKAPWEEVVAQKKATQAKLVAAFSEVNGKHTAQDGALLDTASADELVDQLVKGKTTCTAVANAYIKRAIQVHAESNCLTEIVFHDALQHASQLDEQLKHLSTEGRVSNLPLLGVPVTLKDQFNVKGYDTTIGYVGRANAPASDDAVVVKMLRSLGAVIIAKTNLPQSIMWCETENPLWGLTTNPVHRGYTPGGSTGGEAALLACKASMLGWGTDIGGSIRIPSHMMGIYGLKPSSARLPYRGVPVSTEGQEHVPSAIGPMARSLDTIHLTMTSLINARPWDMDARCAPIPWREDMYTDTLNGPLTIGVLFEDGVVRPTPPITRVLRQAVDVLRDAGHDVIEWNGELHEQCIRVMDKFYTVDGGEDIRRDIAAGGEPFIPHVERLVNRGKPITVYEYWQLNRKKVDLQQAYLEKWDSIRSSKTGRKADIILMPPMPHTAVPHQGCRWVGYTKVWNFLDYPALVIPGGAVCDEDAKEPWGFEAWGPEDEWNAKLWENHRDEMASLRLPVGLQIVGRKLEEERVLAAGKVVDDLLRTKRDA